MIDIDPLSGCRAVPDTPQIIQEAFLEGEEPSTFCSPLPAPLPAWIAR
jgi:hypothetical protein